MLPPAPPSGVDLSAISCGDIQIPPSTFELSPNTQTLRGNDEKLLNEILQECRNYSENRKKLARGAMKKRQNEAGMVLSTIDKTKLRSRREARVTRVKEREYIVALKEVIKWFIKHRKQIM